MSVKYCLLWNHLVPPDARVPSIPSLSREPAVSIQTLRAGEQGQMCSSVAAFFPDRLEPGFTLCRTRCPRVCKTAGKYQKGSGELTHLPSLQAFLPSLFLPGTWERRVSSSQICCEEVLGFA